jgi:hypothetical protein
MISDKKPEMQLNKNPETALYITFDGLLLCWYLIIVSPATEADLKTEYEVNKKGWNLNIELELELIANYIWLLLLQPA